VENLLDILRNEGMDVEEEGPVAPTVEIPVANADENQSDASRLKRKTLGVYLSTWRRGNADKW